MEKTKKSIVRAKAPPPASGPSDIIYVGHLPKGFYEDALEGYFSQFGDVKRVSVSRSAVSGRPKGFAFIQFMEQDVAAVAAQTMDRYPLGGKVLRCHVVDAEKVHPVMLMAAGDDSRVVAPTRTYMRKKVVAGQKRRADDGREQERAVRLLKQDKESAAKIRAAGIDYEFERPVVRKRARAAVAGGDAPAESTDKPATAAAKAGEGATKAGDASVKAAPATGKTAKAAGARGKDAVKPAAGAAALATAAPASAPGKRPRSADGGTAAQDAAVKHSRASTATTAKSAVAGAEAAKASRTASKGAAAVSAAAAATPVASSTKNAAMIPAAGTETGSKHAAAPKKTTGTATAASTSASSSAPAKSDARPAAKATKSVDKLAPKAAAPAAAASSAPKANKNKRA